MFAAWVVLKHKATSNHSIDCMMAWFDHHKTDELLDLAAALVAAHSSSVCAYQCHGNMLYMLLRLFHHPT